MTSETRVDRIHVLRAQIAEKLNDIASLYRDDVKITLIVRVPSAPDGSRDTVMIAADPEQAIKALRKLVSDPNSERYGTNG